jgi:hypothetical protein
VRKSHLEIRKLRTLIKKFEKFIKLGKLSKFRKLRNLHCNSFFALYFIFLHWVSKKIALLLANQN